MTSGYTSAQSLISEVERDSIVAKIIRGNECFEKLTLAKDVISEAETVIFSQGKVISSQKIIITKYGETVAIYKDDERKYKKMLSNQKRSGILPFIKGLAIGLVVGGLVTASR